MAIAMARIRDLYFDLDHAACKIWNNLESEFNWKFEATREMRLKEASMAQFSQHYFWENLMIGLEWLNG